MDFERLPARQAPGAPLSSSYGISETCEPPVTESVAIQSNTVFPPRNADAAALAPHDSRGRGEEEVTDIFTEELQKERLATLEDREARLKLAQQAFHQLVAAWETKRRLWEADYAERLASLEAREARLGSI